MRTAFIAAALFMTVTLGAVLNGCGQKGPLFMPDDHPAPNSMTTSPPQTFSQ